MMTSLKSQSHRSLSTLRLSIKVSIRRKATRWWSWMTMVKRRGRKRSTSSTLILPSAATEPSSESFSLNSSVRLSVKENKNSLKSQLQLDSQDHQLHNSEMSCLLSDKRTTETSATSSRSSFQASRLTLRTQLRLARSSRWVSLACLCRKSTQNSITASFPLGKSSSTVP